MVPGYYFPCLKDILSSHQKFSNYSIRMSSRRNIRKSTCHFTEAKPEKAGRSILKTVKLEDINPTSICQKD